VVKGLQHTIIDTARTGAAVTIEALVASDVVATKIAVMYRPEGMTEFSEAKLKREGDCKDQRRGDDARPWRLATTWVCPPRTGGWRRSGRGGAVHGTARA
jgi:hypothetical protein